MIEWSYSVTPQLRNSLLRIEELRNTLLLTPLPPRFELLLRWEGTVRKIYWSLSLSGSVITKQQVESILTKIEVPKNKESREVLNYKEILDSASFEWIASEHSISLRTLQLLHEKIMVGTLDKQNLGKFRTRNKTLIDQETGKQIYEGPAGRSIENLLSSLLIHLNLLPVKENPIILSAIAQLQIIRILPFEDGNGRIARLLSLLILYKFGFDCKGFLCLEEQYRRELKIYYKMIQNSLDGNFTPWLEYFVQSMLFEMENILEKVEKKKIGASTHMNFTSLSDRQREILGLLDKPGQTITNKKVQKRFKISQITAARDLGKLKTLGILTAIGKGRSTSYRRF